MDFTGYFSDYQNALSNALSSYQNTINDFTGQISNSLGNYQNMVAQSIGEYQNYIDALVNSSMDPYAGTADSYMNTIQNLVQQNNQWSAEQAQKQMDFQERMSNTAHQREIEDLKAAGLNPVLSARLGGSSTPNGAMGTTDTSGTSAMVQLMSKMLDVQAMSAMAAYGATGGNSGYSGSGTGSASGMLSDVENAPLNPNNVGSAASVIGVPAVAGRVVASALNGYRGTPYNKSEANSVPYKIGVAARVAADSGTSRSGMTHGISSAVHGTGGTSLSSLIGKAVDKVKGWFS